MKKMYVGIFVCCIIAASFYFTKSDNQEKKYPMDDCYSFLTLPPVKVEASQFEKRKSEEDWKKYLYKYRSYIARYEDGSISIPIIPDEFNLVDFLDPERIAIHW